MLGRVRLKENSIMDEELPTLLETTFRYLAKNLFIVCNINPVTHHLELKDDIIIPNEVCDRFLHYQQECGQDINDRFVNIFRDPGKSPLRNVRLRNSTITNEGMRILLRHKLNSLSMWYCNKITTASWNILIENCRQLKFLELGRYVDMLKHSEPNEKTPIDFQLVLPQLRHLILNGVVLQPSIQFSHLAELSHLDLTACIFAEFSLKALVGLPKLKALILFNVWPLDHEFSTLCMLKKLEILDLSVSRANVDGNYLTPNRLLSNIVESLANLRHLDISGTNLAGDGVAMKSNTSGGSSDIPGLASRADRPLEFLGLYYTAHSACKWHDIPAMRIAGEATEEQILVAASVYQDRHELLTKVLNDLYHLLRFETCKQIHNALDVVLSAMDKHIRVKHIQISGSATLFYIVKGRNKIQFGVPLKNHIIHTLLNGMSTHLTDDTMMRNGCLTLCQFNIPQDVLFEYERLVRILLHGVSYREQEGFVQRIAIYLLNSLACQVDGYQKMFLGDMGAISTMLNLISDRLSRKIFDDVMEVAWSTMWNVTDETAKNCERFLDGRGMEYFLGCLKLFPDKDDLLRNMMGLLGNVAEVKELRPRLMTPEFITEFADLLDSSSDGIEVSYNAAGVLAHIASDGEASWAIQSPTRDRVLIRMVEAIERWDLSAERNINYRSFEPILGLICCYHTPACQHWAVWALANLTKVYPIKYCRLVERERGVELLQELIDHPQPYSRLKELAQMVLTHCQNFNWTFDQCKKMELDG
ncbi:protein zer-1 homolog [Toxorhynchites rutilus septentrionalis]|uniref:protein zer-1 homolog n=1 Tax=Toxorhynchites rutilus septentrionalis TaxID=329112 RepID=UPI0024796B30|nr:protein zer-1 homolog [Toxorhynchites rutilus septentrionalis]XP_055626641.1 protein zer-1 homolog [Toxorhynchites rutilus septentrionalis]XP_055626642.1 protein zer-1 homolog [Toxorhynchites rutilus septentrionalis]XP_055626643.1 protein zer-1 homolog [Toxorhynchites rutilus septentrionalis]XP_055626645.1 protein zer-1 homolog [Toxorhynchites rutilus septentrionalis]XP_055626646.1 protein zer-1 homolog [Toxorhynchites rutilus septentrionalis]XP_055626647.1 protein zer-1 homolog [Toxorhync